MTVKNIGYYKFSNATFILNISQRYMSTIAAQQLCITLSCTVRNSQLLLLTWKIGFAAESQNTNM